MTDGRRVLSGLPEHVFHVFAIRRSRVTPTVRVGLPEPSRFLPVICTHTWLLVLPVCLGVSLTAGCQAPDTVVEMWAFGESADRVGLYGARDGSDDLAWSTNRVTLAGAINETLSFCFAVRATEDPITEPDLRIAPLESFSARIAPSAVQLFRMHPVPIDAWPGWHIRSVPPDRRDPAPLDVLVPVRAPRGGLPATMLPDRTYYLWADLTIPKGTFEGIYSTEIELLSGGERVGAVAVQLTVWPFILPDEADISVIAELDHRRLFRHHVQYRARPYAPGTDDWRHDPLRGKLDGLLTWTLRLLRGHRLTPVLPQLTPIVKVGARGNLAVDWGQYDAVVEPCLSGRAFFNRVALRHWPPPFHAVLSARGGDETLDSPRRAELLHQYLATCARHFEQKEWLDRSYAVVAGAQTPGVESAMATKHFSDVARRADVRIPILSRLFPQDMRPYGWVDYPYEDYAESVDIWMPPAQFYDAEAMEAQREAGRRTWLTVDRPPYSGSTAIHAGPNCTRVLTWQAAELGAQVLDIGCVNAWPDAKESPAPEDCARHDAHVLLYPGGAFGLDEPVPSVRLKRLRRSLQDAAYCRLLNEHELEHVTATLRRSLSPYAGSNAYRTHFADGRPNAWPDDPRLFEAARHIMAEQLINTSYTPPRDGRAEEFARTMAWRQFMSETRQVRVCVDGARVRLFGTRTAPAGELECALTIMNRTRVPIGGSIRFAQLPAEWTAADVQTVPTIAPGSARRVTLIAHMTVMPTQRDGYLTLPVELTTEDGMVHRAEVRAACVTALPFDGSLAIDGDLSDWPGGTTNVASDFLLITGGSSGPSSGRATRPRNSTIALVMRDSEFLYVAVNCKADESAGATASRRKGVRYDDSIPVGEELVEILIDPLNAGTRSPSDLYHIVVKRSGMDLAEKGIQFDPPVGRREPWPVDIDLATNASSGRWTAELRIPLSAFDPATAEQTTWGFNITRYDAGSREFSTWSGAARNAYDPLSLGNLHLPSIRDHKTRTRQFDSR